MNAEFMLEHEAMLDAEAFRRKNILGDLINLETISGKDFKKIGKKGRVPVYLLEKWLTAYHNNGLEGLKPTDWPCENEIDEKSWGLMCERFNIIAPIIEQDDIDTEEIRKTAEKIGRSVSTIDRWVKRMQRGGVMGLHPNYDPTKKKKEKWVPRDIGALSDTEILEIHKKLNMLGDLAYRSDVPNREFEKRAHEVGKSSRTLRGYWSQFKKHGPKGLAPKTRSDKGCFHNLSPRMIKIVVGIRLTKKDASVRYVHKIARHKAKRLEEQAPSKRQVRTICNNIPDFIKYLADGRENEFRNKSRLTYIMRYEALTYVVDSHLIDVLVKDIRERHRAKSGEIRPWITVVMEPTSRMILAYRLSYDKPDRHMIAAVLHDAFRDYGIPDEVAFDRGKEHVANHVKQLLRDLLINRRLIKARSPQQNGRLERFFKKIISEMWADVDGYVSSNVVDRNPTAKATEKVVDIDDKFERYRSEYIHKKHSSINMTPLAYWDEFCYAEPVDDPRDLDVLLLEKEYGRVVGKKGIRRKNVIYWHPTLGTLMKKRVDIRADTRFDDRPSEIEVYHEGYWICTAFDINSEKGQNLPYSEIRAAQHQQRQYARDQIENAKNIMREVDQEIDDLPDPSTKTPLPRKTDPPVENGSQINPYSYQMPEIDDESDFFNDWIERDEKLNGSVHDDVLK